MKKFYFIVIAVFALLLSSCEKTMGWKSEVWRVQTGSTIQVQEFGVPEGTWTFQAEAFFAKYQIEGREASGEMWFQLGQIEGFEFEEGYNYELRVRYKWDPTTSPSPHVFQLIKVLSKTPAE